MSRKHTATDRLASAGTETARHTEKSTRSRRVGDQSGYRRGKWCVHRRIPVWIQEREMVHPQKDPLVQLMRTVE